METLKLVLLCALILYVPVSILGCRKMNTAELAVVYFVRDDIGDKTVIKIGSCMKSVYLGTKLQKHLENSRQPLFYYRNFRQARMDEQEAICKDETPKCIIASSGMLTGGASVTYAKGLAANEKKAIFLSGYQDAESPSRRLQELSQGDTLTFADGTSVVVNCQVERFKFQVDDGTVYARSDVNEDGVINILELVIIAAFDVSNERTDVNGDGIVNIMDLVIVASDFGKESEAAPAIYAFVF